MSSRHLAQAGLFAATLSAPFAACAVDAVTGVSPSQVQAGTAQRILFIEGSGFAPGVSVQISGNGFTPIAAPAFVPEAMRADHGVGDAVRYTVAIDAAATSGRRDVTVTGPDGTSATGVGVLEVVGGAAPPPSSPPSVAPDMGVAPPTAPPSELPPPSGGVDVVTRASPPTGVQGEQINLWIVGRTFQDGDLVAFSGGALGPAAVNGQALPIKIVKAAPSEDGKLDGIEYYLRIGLDAQLGPIDITVTGPDGSAATGRGVFTVLAPGELPPVQPGAGVADTITGASPAAFRRGRNVSVWLWGRDFDPGAEVSFSQPGIHPYSPYEVVPEAANFPGFDGIRAFLLVDSNVPEGPVDVTVRNVNGTQVTRPGLLQVFAQGGGAEGMPGPTVDACLPDTTSIGEIAAVEPHEVLRGSPLPLSIVGYGFACGAKVLIDGGRGLSAPGGSVPHILRDASDPLLTTLRWDLAVDADAALGPRSVTVVNPNNTSRTVAEAFEIVEELSADGGTEKARGISACTVAAPSPRGFGAQGLALAGLAALAARRRRRNGP